jgi:signal transduction histidine kinase
MKRVLLYVDDEPDNLIVFRASFANQFEILEANSGEQALAILQEREAPVILVDQRMPNMSGVELCEIVRDRHPHTIRMILTGYTEPAAMADAINKGHVYNFITKPWERELLLATLIRGFEAYDLAISNHALTERLAHGERCATLGRLAAGIAHEMGNQLCVLPLVEWIEDNYRECEDLQELAKIVRETNSRLEGLIDEVKAFVRMEDESCPMETARLDLLLHETLSFARFDRTIPAGLVRSEIAVCPEVRANRVKIQQALLNLLKNAVHAVRETTEPSILVSLGTDGDQAVLTVEDNGCGIDEEALKQMWDPFFTTKGAAGTGLGLDITRRIIESHDGVIDCTSTLGSGSRFTIRLPMVGMAVPDAAPCG